MSPFEKGGLRGIFFFAGTIRAQICFKLFLYILLLFLRQNNPMYTLLRSGYPCPTERGFKKN